MRELSGVEVEGMVRQNHWTMAPREERYKSRRNGFDIETWNRILDGKNKLLTEAEDFPHLSVATFRNYLSQEVRLRDASNPGIQRPMVRLHVSDPHAIIIDYRERS